MDLNGHPFEGRLAHQTLGMLLARRLERARLQPLGFVANDYGLAIWGLGDLTAAAGREPDFMDRLFDQDMLGDDLEDWLAESALMKRTFRTCAIIAGLIERRFPGQEKTRRQVTISTVAGLFRCVRFGTGEAHGKGCAVQLDRLLEEGAVAVTDDGRFDIEMERVRPVFAELGRELLTLEAEGDAAGAERLLAEHGELGPAVRSVLERLGDVPVDIRPRYAVVDRMRSWPE